MQRLGLCAAVALVGHSVSVPQEYTRRMPESTWQADADTTDYVDAHPHSRMRSLLTYCPSPAPCAPGAPSETAKGAERADGPGHCGQGAGSAGGGGGAGGGGEGPGGGDGERAGGSRCGSGGGGCSHQGDGARVYASAEARLDGTARQQGPCGGMAGSDQPGVCTHGPLLHSRIWASSCL